MGSDLEISDIRPDSLGHYTEVDDAAGIAYFICEVALGVPRGATVEDGKVTVTAELE